MTDKPTITQADRDAAWIMRPYFIGEEEHDDWKIGGYDESASIRAFAEHRESSVAELQAEVERLREALKTIQNESRRPLVRLVHLKRCIAAQCAALAQKEPVE